MVPARGRQQVVWLHGGLAASSLVLLVLIVVLPTLRKAFGAIFVGGQSGILAVMVGNALVSILAFMAGWFMMREALRRGAPRTVAYPPLAFGAIVVASLAFSASSSTAVTDAAASTTAVAGHASALFWFGVPAALASIAMCAGALVARREPRPETAKAWRFVPLLGTLIVALACSAIASGLAGSAATAVTASGGAIGESGGTIAAAPDTYDSAAEQEFPGWKVREDIAASGGTIVLLDSPAAPTIHLAWTSTHQGSAPHEGLSDAEPALAGFAQAFARRHPQKDWVVVFGDGARRQSPDGSDQVEMVEVYYVPLDAIRQLGSGAASDAGSGDSEQWVATGSDGSLAWMTPDDPRASALSGNANGYETPSAGTSYNDGSSYPQGVYPGNEPNGGYYGGGPTGGYGSYAPQP